MVSDGSQLLLAEEGVGLFSMVLRYGDGTEKRLPATTPAKDLITATEIDYHKYRGEIKRLRDEHPLFEVRPDISMADFEDFVAEALLLPAMIQKSDLVSFFVLGELLHQSLQTEDDGSASFFLHTAEALLYVLEEPIRTQIRLRNIFEMIFDGMERATQRERFERLCHVYPDVGKLCDLARLPCVESGYLTWTQRNPHGNYELRTSCGGRIRRDTRAFGRNMARDKRSRDRPEVKESSIVYGDAIFGACTGVETNPRSSFLRHFFKNTLSLPNVYQKRRQVPVLQGLTSFPVSRMSTGCLPI